MATDLEQRLSISECVCQRLGVTPIPRAPELPPPEARPASTNKKTAARRRRALRRLATELDVQFGPDQSELVFAFDDGWSIRKIRRLADLRREGALMRNCLRSARIEEDNCYSLRDLDNLPHASFAAWRTDTTDAFFSSAARTHRALLLAPKAAFLGWGRAESPLKRDYADRLRVFGASDATTQFEQFALGMLVLTIAEPLRSATWHSAETANQAIDAAVRRAGRQWVVAESCKQSLSAPWGGFLSWKMSV